MKNRREKAYAKLNLLLDVKDPLPDGYHNMEMVMQSCTLHDEVLVTLTDDGNFSSNSNWFYLPRDDRNITVKAARLFFDEIGEKKHGVKVDMGKHTPVCAGLGGGSSDAAAVLRALNVLTEANFSREKLCELGLKLGADVPFCISGGTYFAEGKGEILTKIPKIPDCGIVIVKPKFSISTPKLFSQIDDRSRENPPNAKLFLEAVEKGDLEGMCKSMRNVFEDVLSDKHDEIFAIKSELMENGAIGSMMTGTGSAVFGIYETSEKADEVHDALKEKYRNVFSCTPKSEIRV